MRPSSAVLRAWLPALSYMLLIWGLSSLPLQLDFARVPFRDKGVHFLEYAVLAVLLSHALRGTFPAWRRFSVFALAVLATTVWGLIDEIHQAFVPGRVADARDLMADGIGALAGAASYIALRMRRITRAGSGP